MSTPVIVIASCAGVFVLTGPTVSLLLLFFLLLGELSLHQPLHGGLPCALSAAVIPAASAGHARLIELFIQMLKQPFGARKIHVVITK